MKITPTQYAQTLLELTEKKSEQEVSDIVKSFAEKLKKDGQIGNAKKIMEKFSELYNIKHGIVEAEVVTSRKLESHQVHQVEGFVKEKYQAKEVVLNNTVDEKIKGGVIIKVGDEVLDGSISRQLRELKTILSK